MCVHCALCIVHVIQMNQNRLANICMLLCVVSTWNVIFLWKSISMGKWTRSYLSFLVKTELIINNSFPENMKGKCSDFKTSNKNHSSAKTKKVKLGVLLKPLQSPAVLTICCRFSTAIHINMNHDHCCLCQKTVHQNAQVHHFDNFLYPFLFLIKTI